MPQRQQNKKSTANPWKLCDVNCIPEAWVTTAFSMAECDRPSFWSETDSDLVLSGSVCYSTEFSEDEVLSETGSGASLSLHTEEVLPYLFEPEWSSSGPDVDSTETLDTIDSCEERIGNTDWYWCCLCGWCLHYRAAVSYPMVALK